MEGVRVKSFDVQEKRGGAVRTIIEAEFNNTSPISVQIGSVGFDMSYDDAFIGSAEAANVFVRSGPNVMQLTGELVPPTDVNATHYSQLFTNYLTGKESDVVCTGTGLIVTRRGNTTNVSWLDQAVKSMRMVATLPPSPKSLINDVSFEQLAMDFSANNTDPMVSAQQLLVDFELPFDIKVDVKEVRQSFEVYNSLGQAVGQSPMGTYAPASNTEDPQQIVAALSPSPLIVREDQYTVFSEFLRDIFKANSGQLSMTGTADVIAETALGPVELKGISFKQQTPVSGMQRLQYVKPDGRKSNPVLRGYRVLNGTKDGIVLETNILLHSASTRR